MCVSRSLVATASVSNHRSARANRGTGLSFPDRDKLKLPASSFPVRCCRSWPCPGGAERGVSAVDDLAFRRSRTQAETRGPDHLTFLESYHASAADVRRSPRIRSGAIPWRHARSLHAPDPRRGVRPSSIGFVLCEGGCGVAEAACTAGCTALTDGFGLAACLALLCRWGGLSFGVLIGRDVVGCNQAGCCWSPRTSGPPGECGGPFHAYFCEPGARFIETRRVDPFLEVWDASPTFGRHSPHSRPSAGRGDRGTGPDPSPWVRVCGN